MKVARILLSPLSLRRRASVTCKSFYRSIYVIFVVTSPLSEYAQPPVLPSDAVRQLAPMASRASTDVCVDEHRLSVIKLLSTSSKKFVSKLLSTSPLQPVHLPLPDS